MATRNPYTREFKIEAVKLVTERGLPLRTQALMRLHWGRVGAPGQPDPSA